MVVDQRKRTRMILKATHQIPQLHIEVEDQLGILVLCQQFREVLVVHQVMNGAGSFLCSWQNCNDERSSDASITKLTVLFQHFVVKGFAVGERRCDYWIIRIQQLHHQKQTEFAFITSDLNVAELIC